MLDKFNELDSKDKGTLICGLIVLIMIIFVLGTGFSNNKKDDKSEIIDNNEINKMFENIKDNYIMSINKNFNNTNEEIIYYTDNKLELYENSIYDEGVIKYKDNLFCLNSDNMELDNCNIEYDYVNELYYNYDFIKSLSSECKYKYIDKNNILCSISLNSFFDKYNNIMKTSYSGTDDNLIINIVHNTKHITKINIDYSNVYNIINSSNDKFLINIKFSIGGNDFGKIYDHYKDILEV